MDTLNNDSKVDYLFNPQLFSIGNESLVTFLDDSNNFQLRPLRSTDYDIGYLDLLSQLTEVGSVTRQMYLNTFEAMTNNEGIYYIIVIEDMQLNKIVATGSLILEKKFIHSCGQRGRIEDIVVDSNYRGKHYGKIIVQRLINMSHNLNCYKISLECKDNNVKWYNSMGFIREHENSNFMQIRFEKSLNVVLE